MNELLSLGTKLRGLRKERDLSQRDLANQSGVSANAISLIERNEISPSVATLQRLATALSVRISYFFEGNDGQANVIHLKADEQPSFTSRGVTISGLGRRLREQEVEPFHISLSPGAASGLRPVIHSGHEIVCCLKGMVEYEIDNIVYLLEKGDFLLFEAELPHFWRNPTAEDAEILLVLQTPNESTESVRRHFSNHPSITHFG